MSDPVFPDNTVLCNFASIKRLDLLEGWLLGKGRWVEAVADEARRSAAFLPALNDLLKEGWLGEPLEFEDDEIIARVERVRRDVFGGTAAKPRRHLGEAQTCWLLDNDPAWRGAWWVTDDRDAFDYAKKRGILTRKSIDIFRAIVADGDLAVAQAFELMHDMVRQGRHLDVPSRLVDLH